MPDPTLPDSALPDSALPDSALPGSSAVHLSMERQRMPMGSSMIGSSPQFPSLHSEAKQRLKVALGHHPGSIANGNINGMSHMMEMMSSQQEQAGQHHLQLQAPPHSYHGHAHSGHHHPQSHAHLHHALDPQSPPLTPHLSGPASQVSPGPQSGGGRRRRGGGDDPDERRQKFLERNRAAATRCRQKRKVWVSSLERKAEELSHTNLQLQNEVTQLKSEVTQLKQLLSTHRDCPVTARQKERGYLSPESSPAGSPAPSCSQQQAVQHNSISTSTAVGGDAGHGQLHTHCPQPAPVGTGGTGAPF